jgi:TolA-binding protein
MSQSLLSTAARVAGEASRARGMPRRGQLAPLRVVPAAIRRTGNGGFAVLCMALLAVGLVSLLMMNTALASGIYELKDIRAQSGTLTDQQEQLTQVVDDLRSPRNLADRAQQMGMVPAKSMAFVRLSDGTVIGEAQPAAAEQRLNVVTTAVPPPAPPPAPATSATTAPAATAPANPAATAPATAPAPTPKPTP